jgi:hypothetical protein
MHAEKNLGGPFVGIFISSCHRFWHLLELVLLDVLQNAGKGSSPINTRRLQVCKNI